MKLFYHKIELRVEPTTWNRTDADLKETVFVGVQFKDHKGQVVNIRKERFGRERIADDE